MVIDLISPTSFITKLLVGHCVTRIRQDANVTLMGLQTKVIPGLGILDTNNTSPQRLLQKSSVVAAFFESFPVRSRVVIGYDV